MECNIFAYSIISNSLHTVFFPPLCLTEIHSGLLPSSWLSPPPPFGNLIKLMKLERGQKVGRSRGQWWWDLLLSSSLWLPDVKCNRVLVDLVRVGSHQTRHHVETEANLACPFPPSFWGQYPTEDEVAQWQSTRLLRQRPQVRITVYPNDLWGMQIPESLCNIAKISGGRQKSKIRVYSSNFGPYIQSQKMSLQLTKFLRGPISQKCQLKYIYLTEFPYM